MKGGIRSRVSVIKISRSARKEHDMTQRTHLPIPSRPRTGLITYDAKNPDTRYPAIEPVRPPEGAPNVLVVLLDDVGFGASSAFGGPCHTPTAERLAADGLRYNRFHTTALCSPTRQALLTGRNHHSVGMGGITELATGAAGYSSILPNTMSPIARTLKLNGTYNEMLNFNGMAAIETPEFMAERLDQFGGPDSYNHYAVGWAHAMDTPYQWTKQVASHFGGTRNGTIVHWPNAIDARGEMRWQFHHVIDVAPTILEAAGLPEPLFVNGVQQHPIEGVSMLYSFDDADAPDRHETQYFEMFGNRGIYHKGWTAVTKHKTPWLLVEDDVPAFDDDVWELYDTTTDWSQARNLAAEMPDKLHELQRLWLIEAARYNVLPLDDDVARRMNPDVAGRPILIRGNTQLLFGGMGHLSENCVLNVKNKSHSVTAEIHVPDSGVHGVIVAQGASIGGWALYSHDDKLKYCYNLGGIQHFFAESESPLPAGDHQVRMEFDYLGEGLGGGGSVRLYVDGEQVGSGEVAATLPMIFSADDGCDVGLDSGSPVSPDYRAGDTVFTGRVKGVHLAIAEAAGAESHRVSPEEALRVAMARQ